MSSTACFGVNASNVYNSQGIAGYYTSLVKGKTVLLFGFSLVHESFSDGSAVVDKPISVVLDCIFFFFSETLVMYHVKTSLVNGFFGTSLPDMGSKGISACSKNQMRASMMSLQLLSPLAVD